MTARHLAPALALLATLAPASPAAALCYCVKCLTGSWDFFEANGGAMKPTIEAGDCLYVELGADTPRGSIIAFRHPVSPDASLIFRIVGLPGDQITLRDGQVILNGSVLPQSPARPYLLRQLPEGPSARIPRCPDPVAEGGNCRIPRLTETMPEGISYDILDFGPDAAGDSIGPFTVPPDHVFVLGDNRDDAADSRFSHQVGGSGMIPVANILGPVVEITKP